MHGWTLAYCQTVRQMHKKLETFKRAHLNKRLLAQHRAYTDISQNIYVVQHWVYMEIFTTHLERTHQRLIH